MDSLLEELSDISMTKLVTWISSGAMIFGGMVPYIPQYREIKKTEETEGFSLFVCLSLLVANTLRILFWFGKRYEIPLLIQSIIMNVTMFAMIHLCVSVRSKNQIIRGRDRVFTAEGGKICCLKGELSKRTSKQFHVGHSFCDFDRRYFWAWTDFVSYVDFILLFTIISSVLMYLFIDFVPFVEVIGFLAVFTEALLGVPQVLCNYQNKSTEGMSLKMVIMWAMGDSFKTGYFLVREAPVQFWLCGGLQVCIDAFILCQVYWYRNKPGIRSKKQDAPD
ncbi:PQ-loop repeat-containing protein 1 isoform X1 [Zootermopsis nevadensis]|uniref:PQ-loop repeat-containing protein 1 isoform X1 n=1 Tax=Zootermopsis nevadensis TaxID=136037 RepID=UPI000B8EA20F|nr:PQ-loop repeat-containing protein 1 isoform X1 [Zootermopsis nevadensis]XP_021923448.1 PQ-loop repeat-containing protein 1 isoform X1 [Zootermopsis nevadensis]XP_021923449.1 PQ-loop repeat-containing protein 1 isoform X1 [Zootermopsis nevadensis]XP_021923450.1 PQ-loop repeat-containing protein 1 isoform X1 [Zootermopsis nevadensis]XP_021923451.1 PQ-loop repeat-containing protein 1 isoform X1 [Zootermopsis nevadensis]